MCIRTKIAGLKKIQEISHRIWDAFRSDGGIPLTTTILANTVS